jgi:DNA-binding response OmpR family regulator
LARIRVQLRRREAQANAEVLRFGPLTLNVAAHEARVSDRRIDFTAKEFDLLELFMRHANQVLTREVLYDRIWGYDFGGESNVLEVYIRALRQKLEIGGVARLIQTVRGVGYILREDT